MQPKLPEGHTPTFINPATQPTTSGMPPSYYPLGGQVQYVPSPNIQPGAAVVHIGHPSQSREIAQIRDWLPWSIINMFFGWIFVGILPLTFSLICRSYKRSNNARSANTMSVLALVFNILVTLGGIAGWIGLIVAIVLVRQAENDIITNCALYTYC